MCIELYNPFFFDHPPCVQPLQFLHGYLTWTQFLFRIKLYIDNNPYNDCLVSIMSLFGILDPHIFHFLLRQFFFWIFLSPSIKTHLNFPSHWFGLSSVLLICFLFCLFESQICPLLFPSVKVAGIQCCWDPYSLADFWPLCKYRCPIVILYFVYFSVC